MKLKKGDLVQYKTDHENIIGIVLKLEKKLSLEQHSIYRVCWSIEGENEKVETSEFRKNLLKIHHES